MDWLSKWFDDQTATPTGSVLLFLLVFLTRLAIDQWQRQHAAKKHATHRKEKAS